MLTGSAVPNAPSHEDFRGAGIARKLMDRIENKSLRQVFK